MPVRLFSSVHLNIQRSANRAARESMPNAFPAVQRRSVQFVGCLDATPTFATQCNSIMFQHEYYVVAGDLAWAAEWLDDVSVKLTLFEREKRSQMDSAPEPTQIVKSIILNKDGERFVEK